MSVSIVIPHKPSRDRTYLDMCLDSLKELDDEFEVIVSSEGNKSECRNRAIQETQAEIIVLLDDDVRVRYNTIKELLLPFEDPKVGLVGGVNVAFRDLPYMEAMSSCLYSSPLAFFKSSARYTPRGEMRETDESELISCVMAIRRKVFLEAGGFPVDIIPCEENVLIENVQKLGYKVIYNPHAVVYHRRAPLFWKYWKTIYDYGLGRGRMMKQQQGGLKMLWRPSKNWIVLGIGLLGHYIAYVIGIVKGRFEK